MPLVTTQIAGIFDGAGQPVQPNNLPVGNYTVVIDVSNIPQGVTVNGGKGMAMEPAEVPTNALVIPLGATSWAPSGNQWIWQGNKAARDGPKTICLWTELLVIDGRVTQAVT